MKSRHAHLEGRRYQWETADCYTAMQDWYRDVGGIILPNYIRPIDHGEVGVDLYRENFHREGFRLLDDVPMHDLKIGDGFLISIQSSVATHAAVYVGGNEIFHHPQGRLSVTEPYKGIWKKYTVATLRHPQVAENLKQYEEKVDIGTLLPPHLKRIYNEYQRTHGEEGGTGGEVRVHPEGRDHSRGEEPKSST